MLVKLRCISSSSFFVSPDVSLMSIFHWAFSLLYCRWQSGSRGHVSDPQSTPLTSSRCNNIGARLQRHKPRKYIFIVHKCRTPQDRCAWPSIFDPLIIVGFEHFILMETNVRCRGVQQLFGEDVQACQTSLVAFAQVPLIAGYPRPSGMHANLPCI